MIFAEQRSEYKNNTHITHIYDVVYFKKLSDTATPPTRGSSLAAGSDLYADIPEPVTIHPGETVFIPTGLSVELPQNTFGAIYARSGLGCNHGIVPSNCVGIIDQDYRGEIKAALYNHSDKPYTVNPQDRIAQLIVQPYLDIDWAELDSLSTTTREADGFGSTGK